MTEAADPASPLDPDRLVIAIDGPAGSGKSTVGRRLAAALDLGYLDTGAMYRAVTVAVQRAGIDLDDTEAVAAFAAMVELDLDLDRVSVDGVDVTTVIRSPEVTAAVSRVAANAGVRRELVERQRRWAIERGGGVLEGRDIGTVVFPDATLKVYLTASPRIRAERRGTEMGLRDPAEIEALAADIERRDRADSSRDAGPLALADDAIEMLTDDLGVGEVVDRLIELLEDRRR